MPLEHAIFFCVDRACHGVWSMCTCGVMCWQCFKKMQHACMSVLSTSSCSRHRRCRCNHVCKSPQILMLHVHMFVFFSIHPCHVPSVSLKPHQQLQQQQPHPQRSQVPMRMVRCIFIQHMHVVCNVPFMDMHHINSSCTDACCGLCLL